MKKRIGLILSLFLLLTACSNGNVGKTSPPNKGEKTEVKVSKILRKLKRGKPVLYANATIVGDLDFTQLKNVHVETINILRVRVESPVSFHNCTFEGKLTAYRKGEKGENYFAVFSHNLTFVNCQFTDSVSFRESDVRGKADFSGSEFQKIADFQGTNFRFKSNYFSETRFAEKARFERVYFGGETNFMHAVFDEFASFQNAVFRGRANFGACRFAKLADFGGIFVQKAFIANYVEFSENAIFSAARFQGKADFVQTKAVESIQMEGAFFGGSTKFEKISGGKTWNLKNAVFLLGKPQISETGAQTQVLLENARFGTFQGLETKNFTNQKQEQ